MVSRNLRNPLKPPLVSLLFTMIPVGCETTIFSYSDLSLLNIKQVHILYSMSSINSYSWEGPITSMHEISRKKFLINCMPERKSDSCKLRLLDFFPLFSNMFHVITDINIFKQVSPKDLQF